MKYYAIYNEETQELSKAQCKNLNAINIEISQEIYNDLERYIYQNGEIVPNPNYETEQAKKETERIAYLFLTSADVERGIYKAKGMDFDDIITLVTQLQPQGFDIKALKIELKANNFYRGNPYVDAVGTLLGFTKEMLDNFFETNDYNYLIQKQKETGETKWKNT